MTVAASPCLVGLPYDASSSYLRGPAKAPPAIRAALHSPAGNSWTEGMLDIGVEGALFDVGDLPLSNPVQARAQIESGVARILADGRTPIALGGDHSVTYPVLRAIHAVVPDVSILHIDAHPDLYEEFEGDRYSHASPFARILEDGLARRLVQVGIRTMTGHQRDQAKRYDVHVISMRDWVRGERPRLSGPVYLSLDLDGLDPAFAPGVSHREPGGLSVRDVLELIHASGGTLVGADVVEYNPDQDIGDMTAKVAAKFVKEIAGRVLDQSGGVAV